MELIANGRLQMPRFQRFEAWGYPEVRDLLQTVLDELPAGATLVLEVGDDAPFKYRPLATAPDGPDKTSELLLDGQQRLTALWRSLTGTYEDGSFFVRLTDRNEDTGGWSVEFSKRWTKDGVRWPLWADNPRQTLERDLVPVTLLRPGAAGEHEMRVWVEAATEGDLKRQLELERTIADLRQRIAGFNLPYLYLEAKTKRPVILDVFVKMNTRAVPLTPFDVIVAQVEGETGESLHDLVGSLRGEVPTLERYRDLRDLVLDVAALMQDRPPNKTGYFGIDWHHMISRWPDLVRGARAGVEFLEMEAVFDATRLPTVVCLAPLIALLADLPTGPDKLGNAMRTLRRYLWRSFFTERYERAAATSALQDYRSMVGPVRAGATTADAAVFGLDLPPIEELLSAGWPKKRDRLARALLLLSLRGGAEDIADATTVTPENIGRREYHHLFPIDYLRNEPYITDGVEAFLALNCALVTWRTNRAIGAKAPVEYLKDRTDAQELATSEIERRLGTHGIPYEPLRTGEYKRLLAERAEVSHQGMTCLCRGEPWRPSARGA